MPNKQELMVMALAVKQGLISKDQVQECMDLQVALQEAKGIELPLVKIALKKKFLTEDQASNLGGAAGGEVAGAGEKISLADANRIPIFEAHREIGRGGMATVFLATNTRTGRECALKILFPKHTKNKKFVERFIREGRLLKEFESEEIARGHEYGVYGQKSGRPLYFMSMEYIEGPSIQDLLDQDGPFSEEKAVYVITEAAKGLAYMQEHGVVHRDVKPDNIMWSVDGRVLLVDLGFATPIRSDLAGTFEDETCGTVQYISPEQAKGQADVDIRADIYSLGATLYHMVMGELPFTGGDSMEVMAKQVMDQLDGGLMKSGRISMQMYYFIEKMMAKDREVRYQSARAIVEDIEDVVSGAADMQYNPEADPTSPFAIATRNPHASQRITSVPGLSARFVPAASSGRMAPTGEAVSDRSSGGTSIRRAPLPGATPAPLKRPGLSGRKPLVKTPVKTPVKKPGPSVRLPGAKPGTGKSVRMPAKRRPGDSTRF